MNKKALLAICLAVFIPLISYFILKAASDEAVIMPYHYLPDSINTTVSDGKMTTDTVWHKVANITLVNQLGDTVSLYDIKNKIIIADFFFTSCAYVCPQLTENMARMQQSFLKGGDEIKNADSSIVQFVSFTIDPERDSVAKIRKYADKYKANPENWWFLTGAKDSIYNFIFQELKVDKYDNEGPLDPNFAHTQRFVAIDKDFHVRGFYNGLDTADLARLSKDVGLLMLEKDPNQPEPLPFDPLQMIIFFAITFIVVMVGITILSKNRKAEELKDKHVTGGLN